jgi:hypothetical protein
MFGRATWARFAAGALLSSSGASAMAQESQPRPPDFVVSSPLPVAPARVTPNPRMPVGYLDDINHSLGLESCDDRRARLAGYPVNAVALVEDDETGCVVWDSESSPRIHSFLGAMAIGHARVPVVGYARVQRGAGKPAVIVLDLVGGPAGDISPGLNDFLQEALARRGALVVKPAYAGTRHRSHYPSPELNEAVEEVVAIAKKLRRLNPHAKLIAMGESLGGYVAAKAFSGESGTIIDALALIVPLVYSPEQAVTNFKRLAQTSGQAFTSLWIRTDPSRVPLHALGSARPVPRYAAVSSIDLFESYFPPEDRSAGLLTYLRASKRPALVAYGATDERVGIEALRRTGPLPADVHLLELEHNGHSIDRAVAERIASVLWSRFSLPNETTRHN